MARKKRKKKPASPIKDKRKVHDIQDYLREKSERNYVLFVLGIATGYRNGDLVELRVRDISKALEERYFEIYENKKIKNKNTSERNKKPRIAKVQLGLAQVMEKYIQDKKGYEWAFPSRKGNDHIKVDSYSKILRKDSEHLGLKNISAHSNRKT